MSYIKKAWSSHDFAVINVAYLSDWVATRILEFKRRKEILRRTKKHLNSNLDIILKWGEDFSELQFSRPDAATIIFAKINMPLNCEEFVFDLRDNYSLLLTAGKWHGVEGYVRFGYGTLTYYVKGGLDRIRKYFIKLRSRD